MAESLEKMYTDAIRALKRYGEPEFQVGIEEEETKFDRVIQALTFCPTCGEKLEIHPNTGQPACFLHGDFEVTEVQDSFRVEFKMGRW